MKGRISLTALAASVALASYSHAEEAVSADVDVPTRQYIASLLNFLSLDDARDISSHGLGGSIIYGRQLSDHWWWETEGAAQSLDSGVDGATDYYQYIASTGVAYAFGDRKSFTPFVLANIGVMQNDVVPDDDDTINLHANIGAGFVTSSLFDNGIKFRGEVRYLYDDFDGVSDNASDGEGGFNDWRVSLGLEIPLGETRVVEVERIVYETVEVERVVEVAAADTDGDGIPDSRDKCPNTLPGGKVDGEGCLLQNQTISFNNIGFESGSDTLTASSRPALDKLAESLKSQTDFNVEIAGHTDSVGSAQYNEDLSERRSQAVRKYLIDQGVAADRLSAHGYGELSPIASNDTASGRAMNRRVEFRMSGR